MMLSEASQSRCYKTTAQANMTLNPKFQEELAYTPKSPSNQIRLAQYQRVIYKNSLRRSKKILMMM